MEDEPDFWQDSWQTDVLKRALESAQGLAFVYVAKDQDGQQRAAG